MGRTPAVWLVCVIGCAGIAAVILWSRGDSASSDVASAGRREQVPPVARPSTTEGPDTAGGRAKLESLTAESSREQAVETAATPDASVFTAADEALVWEHESTGLSRADLLAQSDALLQQLQLAMAEPMKKLMQGNVYEIIGRGNKMEVTARSGESGPNLVYEDPNVICGYAVPGKDNPDGVQKKFTLPKAEYPELYAMKRHAVWLQEKASKLARR